MTIKRLMFSPHPDDVCWAMGGNLCEMSAADTFVSTIFSNKEFFLKKRTDGEIRKVVLAEDQMAMKLANVQYEWVGLEDAKLRGYKRLSDMLGEKVVWNNILLEEKLLLQKVKEYMYYLNEAYLPEEVYIPLGVGKHIDHVIVRELAIEIFDNSRIRFYEDMPYSTNEKWYYDGTTEMRHRLGLKKIKKHFTKVEKKKKLIECYVSQLQIRDKNRIFAYQENNNDEHGYYENFWVENNELVDKGEL